jgi:hypothetical protein
MQVVTPQTEAELFVVEVWRKKSISAVSVGMALGCLCIYENTQCCGGCGASDLGHMQ